MQTSSIGLAAVVAAILTAASPGSAQAGGWAVSGRPGIAPFAHMGGFRAMPGAFGRFGQPGSFRQRPGAIGPFADGTPFFVRSRMAAFQRPGQTVASFPFGGAQIIPVGVAGGGYAPAAANVGEERPLSAYFMAPINISLVVPAGGCGDGEAHHARPGGPRIITFERPRADDGAKMPVVIYGTAPRSGC